MTFATEAAKSDSERFALVRIRPKLMLTDATSLGSNNYSFDIGEGYNTNSVIVYPGVETATIVSYTAGVLTVNSSYDLTNAANTAILFHDLFYTGTKTKVTDGSYSLPAASWSPQLASYPSFTQTMRNVTEGVFSIGGSQIEIYDTDRTVQTYSDVYGSFNDAQVTVWFCINSVAYNKLVFEGRVTSISIKGEKISFEVLDAFNKLTQTATFGDLATTRITPDSTLAEFPDTQDYGKAAPITIGDTSPYILERFASPSHPAPSTTATYHCRNGLKLIKDTPDVVLKDSTVTYFVGRFVGTALKKMTFGTVTRCYREIVSNGSVGGATIYGRYYHVKCTNFSGKVGDCLPSGLPGVYSNKLYICHVGTYTGPDANQYDFTCFEQNATWTGAAPSSALESNPTIPDNTYDSFCVFRSEIDKVTIVDDGAGGSTKDTVYYINKFNGTVDPSVVSLGTYGGQDISALYITINYGANFNLFFRIDDINKPGLQCRFTPNVTMTHADTMDFILKSAGMTVNSASITQAETDLSNNISLTLPKSGSDFGTYLDAAQLVARTTFSLLRINSSQEVEYQLIPDPTGETPTYTSTSTERLVDSFDTKIQFQDSVFNIAFKNPQYITATELNADGASTIFNSTKNRYLHGIVKTIEYEHCGTSITDRRDTIGQYLEQPTVEYSFTTSSLDLTTNIGDIIVIESRGVAKSSQTVRGLVTEVSHSPSQTRIKLNELRGITT